MCGVFGIVAADKIDPQQVAFLGELNSARGNSAFGGLAWGSGGPKVSRQLGPFDISRIDVEDASVFLCHMRAPTNGRESNLRDTHPFESRSFLLAHNGLLLNQWDFPEWILDTASNVDSQIILGGIQRHFDVDQIPARAIVRTVGQLEGQQACWLWSKDRPIVYLWRVMSSLYYSSSPSQVVFSSVQCQLARHLLPEGVVYQAHSREMSLVDVGRFDYYSPYKGEGA